MPWKNGSIPEGDLVIFRRGSNGTDGDWYWGLTPATYARHLALVDTARKRTGRDLEPGDGWSTVRPYFAQEIARRVYGNGAAVPGTSSHGGFWEGRETLAIDYSNWSWVYGGDRAAFYADCRSVGLSPGMISPARNYPDEPWHVIDMNPRSAVPAFAGVFTPFATEERLIVNQDDKNYIDGMGASVVLQVAELITGIPAAVWATQIQAQSDQGILLKREDGSPITFPASGYIASTNARAGSAKIAITDEQAEKMTAPLAQGLQTALTKTITQLSATNTQVLLDAINDLPAEVRAEIAAGLVRE